jgi:glycosyltransferase involved in cell wall biosynthesis
MRVYRDFDPQLLLASRPVEKSAQPSGSNPIEISVVVPVRDEEESIRTLLEGLLSQTLPPNEIVFTDGGSIDATREIIEEFISGGAPVKLVRERDSLPGRARNVGVKNAKCDWIAFTDAGTRPAPDWLAFLARKVGDGSDADVVYGSFAPIVDSFFKECAAIAYLPPPVEINGARIRSKSIASALMRRDVWKKAGGFPEHLRSAEDLLFMQRIEAEGFRELRAPDAMVYWDLQPNLWRTFKRFKSYARSNILAGLWRQWQAAIFRQYAVLALIAVPAILFGWRWLLIPIAGWIGMLMARSAKALGKNLKVYPAGAGRNVLRLFAVMSILATVDAGAFVGSLNWVLRDKVHLSRNATK